MAKFRNTFGEDRHVPGHGDVKAGEILEVSEPEVPGFACQPNWEPVDTATQQAADKAARSQKARAKKAAAADG